MRNMIEYLRWRGDVTFDSLPLCEVDYLVFAQLAYLPYDGIAEDDFYRQKNLGSVCEIVLKRLSEGQENTLMLFDDNMTFIKEIIKSPRFAEIPLCGYINIYNVSREEQFSAVTFVLPNENVVAFRGTDSTLVGWKEDFNMAFSNAVPAQLDAVDYLERSSRAYPRKKLHVCGHSKGGNLAVYASAFCHSRIRNRIVAVRNLDGPGFSAQVVGQEGFKKIMSRTKTIIPGMSVVGMLLEYAEEFTVIKSYAVPAYQHNPFTWEIERDGFVILESVSDTSKYIDSTLKDWIAQVSPEKREKIINGIYDILVSANILDVRDILAGKNILPLLQSITKLDTETRGVLLTGFEIFRRSAKTNLPPLLEKLRAGMSHK